jgi:peptide/nickel transport system permease protein
VFGYIIRRLATSIPVLLVASVVVFLLVATSGDPLSSLKASPNASPETIRAREVELNLDKPLYQRYAIWAKDAVRGDLGESTKFNEPVTGLIWRRLGVTVRLVLFATVLGVLIAIAIGVFSAIRQYSWFDHSATAFALIFFSMPVFWLAAVLKDVGVRINKATGTRIFYTIGERTPNLDAGFVGQWTDRFSHMLLPSLTLILISVAGWSRYQRASMLDVMRADYVRTARAKGLSESKVVRRHALRNAMIPLVTVVALDFAAVMSGTIVTETVFAWKGMGTLLIEALNAQDTNVILGWLLVTAIIVILFNLAADIYYGYLDPRIRNG